MFTLLAPPGRDPCRPDRLRGRRPARRQEMADTTHTTSTVQVESRRSDELKGRSRRQAKGDAQAEEEVQGDQHKLIELTPSGRGREV